MKLKFSSFELVPVCSALCRTLYSACVDHSIVWQTCQGDDEEMMNIIMLRIIDNCNGDDDKEDNKDVWGYAYAPSCKNCFLSIRTLEHCSI